VFLGLFGMIDPARPEVPPALARARKAGIRTIMITGDYPDTAAAIGRSIGLLQPGRQVMPGADLERLDDAALVKALDTTDIFARVSPTHKVRIVEAVKQRGEVVAMTGDGVNDAPALKRADIGIAMGIAGTDVAKETADMVLTDDNYASIVSAVEQGRIIYANIRKFVFFLLSSNVAEIMIIFLATLAGLPSPLTAIQILWLNLVTDGAPALALALEKGDSDVMDYPPRYRGSGDHADQFRAGRLWGWAVLAPGPGAVGGRQPAAGADQLRLVGGGRADSRNDGVCDAVAGGVDPGLYGALRAAVDLPIGIL
jgi:Ca2+-transporting ATPase